MAPLLTIEDRLDAWLDEACRWEGAWGVWDCLLAPADWVATLTGHDPAASLRGRYRSAFGAARLVVAAGGMAGLMGRQLRPLGWTRTRTPRPGDVAVIRTRDSLRTGAVRFGGRWAVAAHDQAGMLLTPGRAMAAWTPPLDLAEACR